MNMFLSFLIIPLFAFFFASPALAYDFVGNGWVFQGSDTYTHAGNKLQATLSNMSEHFELYCGTDENMDGDILEIQSVGQNAWETYVPQFDRTGTFSSNSLTVDCSNGLSIKNGASTIYTSTNSLNGGYVYVNAPNLANWTSVTVTTETAPLVLGASTEIMNGIVDVATGAGTSVIGVLGNVLPLAGIILITVIIISFGIRHFRKTAKT